MKAIYPGSIIWGQFSGWQLFGGNYQYSIILWGNSLSAACLRANYLGAITREGIFWGGNYLGGKNSGDYYPGSNCPGGNYAGGNCPGGNCLGRGQLSWGAIVWGAIVWGAIVQGEVIRGAIVQGGSCPKTIQRSILVKNLKALEQMY